jgi:hypothetical protein
MIHTAASAAAEIKRLGLPAFFGAIINGTSADMTVPTYLRRECRRPYAYFSLCSDLVHRAPRLEGFCPLWEQNGEAIIGRLPDGRYVRFHFEDASLENSETSIEVLGKNYQQFVTSILVELREAGLWEHAVAVATLLGYQYLTELRAILDAWTEEHGERDLVRFRDSLP